MGPAKDTRVDDPGLACRGRSHHVERFGLCETGNGPRQDEVTRAMGLAQGLEELRSEDFGQSAHGEEEAGLGVDPAQAIVSECSTGDDAVQMDVLREVLAPRMQDRRDTESAPEGRGSYRSSAACRPSPGTRRV
jgi:hypothetical protein